MLEENLYNHPQEYKGRRVTYQVAFRGTDGMVIASDQRELLVAPNSDMGTGAKLNLVRKIRIDSSGCFAWAYAGGKVAPIAAECLNRKINGAARASDEDLEQMIVECGNEAWVGADGPDPNSTILLVEGATKTIRRAKLLPNSLTAFERMEGSYCIAGLNYSLASLFAVVGYAESLSVDSLVPLAAYMLLLAERIDPLCIAGADIAVYRKTDKRFEFLDQDSIGRAAKRIDRDIRKLISDFPQRKPIR